MKWYHVDDPPEDDGLYLVFCEGEKGKPGIYQAEYGGLVRYGWTLEPCTCLKNRRIVYWTYVELPGKYNVQAKKGELV